MAKRTTKKPAAKRGPARKGSAKRAPLAVGARAGSEGAAGAGAKLARLADDLVAAIEQAEGELRRLRGRVEELRAEVDAPERGAMLAMARPPEGGSTLLTDG